MIETTFQDIMLSMGYSVLAQKAAKNNKNITATLILSGGKR
jgi:hypothetical protein